MNNYNRQPSNGQLVPDYHITCGDCGYGEYVDGKNKTTATKEARKLGWAKTKAFGWVCRCCKAERQV